MRRCPFALAASFVIAALTFALPTPAALAQSVSTFASGLPHVRAFAFDGSGNMYVARRTPSNVIEKCTPPSNAMSFLAGGFYDPVGLVCDASGNVYVADYDYGGAGGAVLKVTPGGAVSVVAVLPNPTSLAIDPSGNLYVGRWDGIINKITPGNVVSTHADLKTLSYLGVLSVNNHVTALVRESDGTLFAALSWGALFKVGPGGSPITGFNRVVLECFGLTQSADTLYASSYTHDTIWKIALDGSGTLFAGKSDVPGFVNGQLLSARFHDPAGLAVNQGVLYVADYSNSAVRAIADLPSPTRHSSWGRVKALFR